MATLVNIDVVGGANIAQNFDGFTVTRIAILEDVDGNADEKQFNAINDNAIPNIGDAHPVVIGVTLSNKTAESIGKGQFRVTMIYANPNVSGGSGVGSPTNVTVSTVLQDIEVTTFLEDTKVGDKDFPAGSPITVAFSDLQRSIVATETSVETATKKTFTIDYETVPREREQTRSINIKVPLITVTFQRRTTIPPLREAIGPRTDVGLTVGSINEQEFIFRGDQSFWLCTRIDGTSPDAGQTFDTTYEFVGAPPVSTADGAIQTWDIPLFFIDLETGNPPLPVAEDEPIELRRSGKTTLETSNGLLIISPYPAVSFSFLDLIRVGELT